MIALWRSLPLNFKLAMLTFVIFVTFVALAVGFDKLREVLRARRRVDPALRALKPFARSPRSPEEDR